MPPKMSKLLLTFSDGRKRALGEADADDEDHQNKKRYIRSKDTDRDDTPDSDFEARFSDTSDDEDPEKVDVDVEPEQGEILWSEDQEAYPPCAIYHPDVKEHQACITEFAMHVTKQLSRVRYEGDDIAKLHTEAVACQKFPELKKIVVALVGDAGSGIESKKRDLDHADIFSGKSSLINSILDVPHIAREVYTNLLEM